MAEELLHVKSTCCSIRCNRKTTGHEQNIRQKRKTNDPLHKLVTSVSHRRKLKLSTCH